ncbi:MAG: ABC transporter substrate-binding protein [Desulfobacteraceae bacterium]
MKRLVLRTHILLVLMLVPTPYMSSYAEDTALKIGATFALTGPAAPGIKGNIAGVRMAAEWINERGGISVSGKRYPIEILAEDNKSTPDGIIAATNKLLSKDQVKFIVGPVLPWLSIAMTPITEKAQVLRCKVNGTGTPAEMNRDMRYTFSTFMEIQYITCVYEHFVERYPNAKRVAIIGPDEPGGQIFMILSKKEAESRGLKVVFSELYPIGTEDFYPILTKALAQKPDAFEMGVGVAPWYAGIIKQARELRFNGPMFAPSATGDIYLVNMLIGKAASHDVFFLDSDLKSSQMPPLIGVLRKRISDKYSLALGSDHCFGWEALWCLTQAIEAAQSLDTTMIAKTWENMKNIDTLYGKGTMGGLKEFGINHVVMKPRPITRLENGKVEFVKFITP